MKLVRDQITIASILIGVLLLVGWVANFYLANRAIATSNHRWCTTLSLLTSNGPPSKKLPPAQYRRGLAFYQHLKELESSFGC